MSDHESQSPIIEYRSPPPAMPATVWTPGLLIVVAFGTCAVSAIIALVLAYWLSR